MKPQLLHDYIPTHIYTAAVASFVGPSKVTVPEADGSVTVCIKITSGVSDEYPVSVMVATTNFLLGAEGKYITMITSTM